jgi:HAE1 family hydrophobic/amphiphilic exporter-1
VLGLVSLGSLPIAEYPEIVPPTIQVSTSYPGASADVVAATVGIPIEQAVNGVEGSIATQSTSGSDGNYTLTITFDVGTNLDTSISLVQNAVNGALAQLPSEVQTQGVAVQKVSTNVLLIGSLYSKDDRFDETFLSNYAIINLRNPLARLPGVGQVAVLGAGPYSMRIWLDPLKLKTFGLTVVDVQNAVQNQNVQVAAGQLGGPARAVGPDLPVHGLHARPSVRRRRVREHHREEPGGVQLGEAGGVADADGRDVGPSCASRTSRRSSSVSRRSRRSRA